MWGHPHLWGAPQFGGAHFEGVSHLWGIPIFGGLSFLGYPPFGDVSHFWGPPTFGCSLFLGCPYLWASPHFWGTFPIFPIVGLPHFCPPCTPNFPHVQDTSLPCPIFGVPPFPQYWGGFVSHPSKVGQLSLALLLLSLGAPIRAEGGPPFLGGGGWGTPSPPVTPNSCAPPQITPRL